MPPTQLRLFDYAASANCYKVRLLLAQLGTAYERVPVDIFGGRTLGADYAALNPARETPVLEVDGDRHLPESGAILFHLAEGTELLPSSPWPRAQVLRWLLFEQTQVMSTIGGLRFRLLTGRLRSTDAAAERRREAGRAALAVLDEHLSESRFLVEDRYTIADIAVFGYAHVAGEAGIDLAAFGHVERWIAAVAATPGFMDDLAPYPANARPGAGRSIYGGA